MAILKIRDAEGNVQEILAIKGEDYVLTEADKQEIAQIVVSMSPTVVSLDENRVLELIRENMPSSAEGVKY